MATTIHAPVEGYEGVVAGVEFEKGVGTTDSPTALAYFRRHGYGIGGRPEPAETAEPEPHDEHATVGTPLRDAVVDPDPEDDPADQGEPFDPADHTVEEVEAYLADADDAERHRVLDAEQSGKARKSLLDA